MSLSRSEQKSIFIGWIILGGVASVLFGIYAVLWSSTDDPGRAGELMFGGLMIAILAAGGIAILTFIAFCIGEALRGR